MKKILAIVGMAGAGKSEVADFFIRKGFDYIRLGQLTLDEVKRKKLPPGEESERKIRENIRKIHGMAAFAILNFPNIDKLRGDVVVDGLYSWEEYLVFKKKYKNFYCIAVYANPQIRYQRLVGRSGRHGIDDNLKYRSFKKTETPKRDQAEIENLNKGGPIAMADFTIINEGTKKELEANLKKIWQKIKTNG